MNQVWMLTAEDILLVYEEAVELAKQRGKKSNDNINNEVIELLIKKGKVPKYLGNTEKDTDQLTGDLREEGIKVLNLNEEERKKKIKEENNDGPKSE